MADLACVWCEKPAFTVENGNALCYDHFKSPNVPHPSKYKKMPPEVEEILKKYLRDARSED